MKRLSLVTWFFVLLSATAAAEDTKDIPLDQIWGYNLPGTRDIAGIPFPQQKEGVGQTYTYLDQEREHNIEQIRLALAMKPTGEKALPGFVIPGQLNSRILLGVHPQLRGKPGPIKRDSFPAGDELTLVFFSHPLSYFARLRKVEQEGNQITVYYQFEPHTTPEATVHFALIPLGELPPGEYRVTYKQTPIDEKYRAAGFEPVHPEASEIVCRDFSFTVVKPSNAEPVESAVLVPLDHIWGYRMIGTLDAGDLDAVKTETGTSHPVINAWQRQMWDRFKKGEAAGPAFVVEGVGRKALDNALAVFNDDDDDDDDDEQTFSFSDDADLSLVFFTYFVGCYVHIESVERAEQKIIVKYRFVLHPTRNMSFHFGLIPLRRLPPGKYRIEITQLPPIDTHGQPAALDRDLTGRVCCDSSFYIQEGKP